MEIFEISVCNLKVLTVLLATDIAKIYDTDTLF